MCACPKYKETILTLCTQGEEGGTARAAWNLCEGITLLLFTENTYSINI